MEDSYGVPFGKKSKTVTRRGTLEEVAQKEKPEVAPAFTQYFQIDRQTYPVYIVGHASRKDLKRKMTEESNNSDCSNKRDRSEIRHDFDHLISAEFNNDLPHPSKLRKVTSKKQGKMNRLIERHMCVDNHLRQLRQRNNKYREYKLEEENKSSACSESHPHSLQVPNFPSESIDTPNTLLEQTPSTSLSFQTPHIDFHFMKKSTLSFFERHFRSWDDNNAEEYMDDNFFVHCMRRFDTDSCVVLKQRKSNEKQLLFPPGSVVVSASLEQEEEDKWFQQLWKPRCSSQTTEE